MQARVRRSRSCGGVSTYTCFAKRPLHIDLSTAPVEKSPPRKTLLGEAYTTPVLALVLGGRRVQYSGVLYYNNFTTTITITTIHPDIDKHLALLHSQHVYHISNPVYFIFPYKGGSNRGLSFLMEDSSTSALSNQYNMRNINCSHKLMWESFARTRRCRGSSAQLFDSIYLYNTTLPTNPLLHLHLHIQLHIQP